MNSDTSPTPIVLWEFFPAAQMIGTTRYPQHGGEAYSLGTGLADRLNQYQRDNQCLFDSVSKLERELAEKTAENQKLRELLENILDAVPAMYREQYEQIIK